MSYTPAPSRYDAMAYPHSGKSGLRLPLLTLGLWHNFGENCDIICVNFLVEKVLI